MPNIGITELIIILVILLLLFGSSRLPSLARGMGKSINEFKKGISEGGSEADREREATDARREQLRDGDRIRDDERATSDNFTVNKPR
ncbi:MAG: twin-arginine translocase TatA/TatE family subunit [Rubrivivax sp.]|nr:twin-arginine translocase TatA/TatE family subunit [Pyrinomonadaceae bacterium]